MDERWSEELGGGDVVPETLDPTERRDMGPFFLAMPMLELLLRREGV